MSKLLPGRFSLALPGFVAAVCGSILVMPQTLAAQQCTRTVTADVVALDQLFFYNRLGAHVPHGMIYALSRDVVHSGNAYDGQTEAESGMPLTAGNVRLRDDKRPRPLTLRMNVGDCLQVNFTNLLGNPRPWEDQPITRAASFRVLGMQLVGSIASDGSSVGRNESSLVAPGSGTSYSYYAEREGAYFAYSAGAQTGAEGDGGGLAFGLFAAVNVEPVNAEWYRSQLTREEMDMATNGYAAGGQPVLDYDALYPDGHRYAGTPIIRMLDDNNEIVHSDLMAVITGANRGYWNNAYSAENCTLYEDNPTSQNRCAPFREFTIIFHDEIKAIQAFNNLYVDPVLGHTLHSVRDGFAINYGTGGIGSEIIANRVGLGPMKDCNECKYEEFFLTSWAVGDPAMVVDVPAWQPSAAGPTGPGVTGVATKALYPDDPSNVYHSYMNDNVKIRNLHAGPKEHHIFHLHAHQWLNTPDSDESAYMDSQAIGPGSGYTYDVAYDGSGNRPKTPGDAIFHCHFYPHFAQGMWALWRVHDTFERGTLLDGDGKPIGGMGDWQNRVLPDGEIAAGTPTPAVVPVPSRAMAPMPTAGLPGFPFYIPGVAGHRPPQPPLDFAPNPTDGNNGLLDGGLPRHVITGGVAHFPELNRLDFSKENVELIAQEVPHDGTELEKRAMAFHGAPNASDALAPVLSPEGFIGHPTYLQPASGDATDAVPAYLEVNGLAPAPGAPFADPCRADGGASAAGVPLLYKGASFQIDAAYTKSGWHFPQHRMLGLNADVGAVMGGEKPAEPFFFRANTNHCISYWLTNLLPKDYELDDFQVLTPTDVMGQHIHLVKFDVMASDGAANGWNYEDGSLSPQEVQERIHAINATGGLMTLDGSKKLLEPELHPFFGSVSQVTGNKWGNLALGAQSTVQRWFADDVVGRSGKDRTLRTVFTHDHFAPSTQQQAGYYAGLVVEPEGAVWRNNETGEVFGPPEAAGGGYGEQTVTSWQAIIDMTNAADADRRSDSYREFVFEYQDFQLAYTAQSDNTLKSAGLTVNIVDTNGNVVDTKVVKGIHDRGDAINPPAKNELPLPLLTEAAAICPGGAAPPCPEAISADDPGIMTVNYRAEPIPQRVLDPNAAPDATTGALQQAQSTNMVPGPGGDIAVEQGDLSFAFVSGFMIPLAADCTGKGKSTVCKADRTPIDPATGEANSFERAHPDMNKKPEEWPYLSLGDEPGRAFATGPLQAGALAGDPITPLLRGYAGDILQIRQLVGAHEEGHNFSVNGVRWLFEPNWVNSGYRSSQMAGISEHFEFELKSVNPVEGGFPWEDYLYMAGAAVDDLWGGAWGFIRSYSGSQTGIGDKNQYGALATLPNNPKGDTPPFVNATDFRGVCPVSAPVRNYSVYAVRAADLDSKGIEYNSDGLYDPNGIVFVHTEDVKTRRGEIRGLNRGLSLEPLIIRANAGDCIELSIEKNMLPADLQDHDGWSTLPLVVQNFNSNELQPSSHIGLTGQLVEYDVHEAEGTNVGWNGLQTLAPGASPPKGPPAVSGDPKPGEYHWYAGSITMCVNGGPIAECEGRPDGWRVATPIEFGAAALMSSDRIKHAQKGAIGAMVIEPEGSTWLGDGFNTGADGVPGTKDDQCAANSCSRASATVTLEDGSVFRDFVLVFQDDVNMVRGDGTAVENLAESEDPEDSGQKAFNYKTEPMWLRLGFDPDRPITGPTGTVNEDFEDVLSSAVYGDPETPIFTAERGTPIRFRVVQSGGHARNHVFTLHGHVWQQLPFTCASTKIGDNKSAFGSPDGCSVPGGSWVTEFKGSQEGLGPTSHWNFIPLHGAGGVEGVVGDYLYRDFASFQFDGGLWGILRVCPENSGGNSGNKECLP